MVGKHKELLIVAKYFGAPYLDTKLSTGTQDTKELILSIFNISQYTACIGAKKKATTLIILWVSYTSVSPTQS